MVTRTEMVRGAVVLADQVDSRRRADNVPEALKRLAKQTPTMTLPFERTAGDEIQAFTTDPTDVVAAVEELARMGGWRIGIGIGDVEAPLPATTREARGTAYHAARQAIGRARTSTQDIAVDEARAAGARSDDGEDREHPDRAYWVESALLVTVALLNMRTDSSWEAIDLAAKEPNQHAVAARLGITQGAVSRRLKRGHAEEVRRGLTLARDLLKEALESPAATKKGE